MPILCEADLNILSLKYKKYKINKSWKYFHFRLCWQFDQPRVFSTERFVSRYGSSLIMFSSQTGKFNAYLKITDSKLQTTNKHTDTHKQISIHILLVQIHLR